MASAEMQLLVALFLLNLTVVLAAPVLAPDLNYCHLPLNLPDGEMPFDCCAPVSSQPAIDFNVSELAIATIRVRPAAHTLDAHYAEKLNRAYALMKSLPDDDPRSFKQQANIHCAYCSAAYQMRETSATSKSKSMSTSTNATITPLQVHSGWLFYAFHRWYLYFHERILASLIEDDTFGLPFWNYDHPDGMSFPPVYSSYPNLTDEYREPSRLPNATIMLDFYFMNASNIYRSPEEQVAANLAIMHRMVVSGATTQYSFFGQPYRAGDDPEPGPGTTETMPHNSIHGWTGDQKQLAGKDMGTLYAAGRDPVFYTHHASLDRIWEVWKSLGNLDIDDEDYLNSEFVFYDENAQLVKVKVKDCLNTTKLGYVYADVENVWINLTTSSISSGVAILSNSDKICSMGDELSETCSLVLSRDKEAALEGEEILVINDIQGTLDSPTHFEVFVNLPQASLSTTTNCIEYVGRFSPLPQVIITNMTGNYRSTSTRFAIGKIVEDLGLEDEESIVVTLVPSTSTPFVTVTIGDIMLEYETNGLSYNKRMDLFAKRSSSNDVVA